jgi:hypothetical protein
VLIRTSDVNVARASDALATVTSFAHAGNVDTVLVGGELRKFRGHLMAARGLKPHPVAERGAGRR